MDCAHLLRPIAHRGLHDAKRRIIENTAPAFEAAIAMGYGIECDLQPAAGGVPLVFHDETIDRLVEGKGAVSSLKAADIKRLRYKGVDTQILTFAELLDLVGGRVPLLVEVKSAWEAPDMAFLRKISRLANIYRGPIGLMSFDPAQMAALRTLSPGVPRGIISGSYRGSGWVNRKISKAQARRLSDLLDSGPAAPSFYAFQVSALPTAVTEYVRGVQGLPIFAWTVRTSKDRAIATKHADAVIFEGFAP